LSYTYFLFLLFNKKKIVLTVHNPIENIGRNKSFKRWFKRKITFLTIKKHILLNRNQTQKYLTKYKKSERDIYFSALSVYDCMHDYKQLDEDENVTISTDFNILFFGRITLYKGVEYLLQAFEMLQQENIDNISLTIAGGGNFPFDITKYKQNSRISILNKVVPNEELNELIRKSSIVVCPYIDATQSGVIMTAFAFNKPVIATNVGGLGEMVDDRKTGILIPPKNAMAIKEAIKNVYENQELLSSMSQAIFEEWHTGQRSWDSIANGLIDIYNDVINSKE
jgi:glycosyltransferase involved in cell wall biosynthesis